MSAKSTASASSTVGTIQFPHPLWTLLIIFGLYVCYACSLPDPLHFSWLSPFKSLGLTLFRSETGIWYVFVIGCLLHVYEGAIAARFAVRVKKNDIAFVLFWFVQTLIVGYPSLRLIKNQRAIMRKNESKKN